MRGRRRLYGAGKGLARLPHYLAEGEKNDLMWVASWTGREAGEVLLADRQPWKIIGEVEQRVDCWGVTWERSAGPSGSSTKRLIYE